MITQGTTFRCQNCQTEVEVLNAGNAVSSLVCCEIEMKQVGDEYELLWEKEAYDSMDYQWD